MWYLVILATGLVYALTEIRSLKIKLKDLQAQVDKPSGRVTLD